MAFLITPRGPLSQQPQYPAPINWGNSLTRGLVFCAVPQGSTWRELLSGQTTTNGSVRPRASIDGNGASAISGIGATSVGGRFANPTGLDLIAGPGSIFAEGSLEVNASTQGIVVSREPNATGDAFGLQIDDAATITNGLRLYQNNGIPAFSNTDALNVNSEQYTHRFAVTVDGNNARFYTKGNQNSAVALASTPNLNAGRRTTILGIDNNQGSASASIILAWNRAISSSEYRSLYDNPWQIFQSPRKFFPSAAVTIQAPSRSIRTTAGGTLTQQPQYAAPINSSNPLARGLRVAINGSQPGRNVLGAVVTVAGGVTTSIGRFGVAQSFNGSSQTLAIPLDLSNTQGVTVLSLTNVRALTGQFNMFWELTADGAAINGGITCYTDVTAGRTTVATGGTATEASVYSQISVGERVIATVIDRAKAFGTQASLFLNGVQQSPVQSVTGSNSGPFANSTLNIASRAGSSLFSQHDHSLFLLFDRALSANEIAALSANPWQLFQAPRKLFPSAAVTVSSPSRSIRTTAGAPLTQQPQYPARINPKYASRLKFAFVPSIGFLNLANGANPLQQSATLSVGVSASGITYEGNARAEYGTALDANGDLTLISIWRSRQSSQYLSADGDRYILSTRTAGNAGWAWGHTTAVGGGAGGTIIPQQLVLQGVAAYSEANPTIASLVDTPVACRYVRSTGLISWFAFGKKSSPDTAAATTATVGGNLVLGAQGEYAANFSPWIDRASAVLAFQGALSDNEIAELTSSTSSIWQIFQSPPRKLFPSAAVTVSSPSRSIRTTVGAPLTQQPQYPAAINRSHPIGAKVRNFYTPGQPAGTGNAGTVATAQGLAYNTAGAGSIAVGAGRSDGRFTVMSGFVVSDGVEPVAAAGQYIFSCRYDGVTEPFVLRLNSSRQLYTGSYNPSDGSSGSVTQASSLPLGASVVGYALVGAVAVIEPWYVGSIVNGVDSNSTSTLRGATRASFATNIGGADINGTFGRYYSRPIQWVIEFNGHLTADERAAVASNPWQLFQSPRRLSFGAAAVQLLRPSSDISAGAWTPSTGVNLFAMLNEAVASDATFDLTSAPSTFEVGLTAGTSPGVTTGHVVRYRIIGAVTVSLRQGTTTIASWSQAPTAMTTYVQTLTSLQAAAITNYAALSLQFQAV